MMSEQDTATWANQSAEAAFSFEQWTLAKVAAIQPQQIEGVKNWFAAPEQKLLELAATETV